MVIFAFFKDTELGAKKSYPKAGAFLLYRPRLSSGKATTFSIRERDDSRAGAFLHYRPLCLSSGKAKPFGAKETTYRPTRLYIIALFAFLLQSN